MEYIFCYWHFLTASIFKSVYFLKWCPICDSSPLHQFSKYNNFFSVCWFLGKNISKFVSLDLKLHNCKIGRNSCFFESRAKILDQSFPIVLTSVRLIYLKQSASHGRFMVLWNSFRMSEKLRFRRKNDWLN